MDKNILVLLGAVGALAGTAPAHAGMATVDNALTPAASYADLLKPIPNAVQVLHSEASAFEAVPQATAPAVQDVQFIPHHHHHHHHRYYRRRHYHHHHHRPY